MSYTKHVNFIELGYWQVSDESYCRGKSKSYGGNLKTSVTYGGTFINIVGENRGNGE